MSEIQLIIPHHLLYLALAVIMICERSRESSSNGRADSGKRGGSISERQGNNSGIYIQEDDHSPASSQRQALIVRVRTGAFNRKIYVEIPNGLSREDRPSRWMLLGLAAASTTGGCTSLCSFVLDTHLYLLRFHPSRLHPSRLLQQLFISPTMNCVQSLCSDLPQFQQHQGIPTQDARVDVLWLQHALSD